MILILIMQALFAATFPIGKLALEYTGPIFLTAIRFIIAGILLLTFYCIFNSTKPLKKITGTDWLLLIKTAFFYVFLAYIPEFWALIDLSSFKTNMLWSSYPFVSALLSYFLIHERLTKNQLIGICIGLMGTVPILLTCDTAQQATRCPGLSEISLFIAIVSTAYAWFLIKELLNKNYPLLFINGTTMLIGGLMSLACALILQTPGEALYTDGMAFLGYTMALVISANIIAYTIYGKLLNKHSITFLSFSGSLCPIFGAIYGKIFMHEQLALSYAFAFVIIIFGLYIFYKDEIKFTQELAEEL